MRTIINEERAKCVLAMRESKNVSHEICFPDFDGSLCWPQADLQRHVVLECPFEFCPHCVLQHSEKSVGRFCTENGTWTTSNYNACLTIWTYHKDCINAPCSPCPDAFKSAVQNITLLLSFASVICLLASFCLFSIFKSLQCPRLKIHKHLCLALIARFTSMIIWILAHRHHVFSPCDKVDVFAAYACKATLFVILYCTCASVYWMLVEGLYLASRISLFALQGNTPLFVLAWLGWGAPLVLTVVWSMLMTQLHNDKYCWLPYSNSVVRWILVIPMLFALIGSLLLLIFILIVLVRKMTAHHAREPKKLWKAAKAALLLSPLLGVTNLLFFVEPGSPDSAAYKVYIVTNAIVQHSQGIFLAVLYCFLNEEMRNAIKNALAKSRRCSLISQRSQQHRMSSMTPNAANLLNVRGGRRVSSWSSIDLDMVTMPHGGESVGHSTPREMTNSDL